MAGICTSVESSALQQGSCAAPMAFVCVTEKQAAAGGSSAALPKEVAAGAFAKPAGENMLGVGVLGHTVLAGFWQAGD